MKRGLIVVDIEVPSAKGFDGCLLSLEKYWENGTADE